MENITHNSGNTIRTVPSPFDRAGFDLALIKLEQRIASLESDADRINCNANVANDRIDALIDRIDKLEAENAALREMLIKARSGRTLADRILNYFLYETHSKALRSSDVRKIFKISTRGQANVAMKTAAERSGGAVSVIKLKSNNGYEISLVKNDDEKPFFM